LRKALEASTFECIYQPNNIIAQGQSFWCRKAISFATPEYGSFSLQVIPLLGLTISALGSGY